jgi:hypothetical protein
MEATVFLIEIGATLIPVLLSIFSINKFNLIHLTNDLSKNKMSELT